MRKRLPDIDLLDPELAQIAAAGFSPHEYSKVVKAFRAEAVRQRARAYAGSVPEWILVTEVLIVLTVGFVVWTLLIR